MTEKALDLTISIVLYANSFELVNRTIESVFNSDISFKLFLIDNSPTDQLRVLAKDKRIEYIFNNENIGFGRGHNKALELALTRSEFHLVLNPDVYFDPPVLPTLLEFMGKDKEVGLIMPMVYNFDSEMQYLCRRLPTPIDLVLRRFGGTFVDRLSRKRTEYYEMRDMDYKRMFTAPYLSGCFMLLRLEALKNVGLFDERYFMYLEDIDLSRRVSEKYKTVYYPDAFVYHGHAKDSYTNFRLLGVHIKSAIKYFNKWGWFFDTHRKRMNTEIEYYSNSDKRQK
ncbi:MAG: glycosyltransferase family 2 protein [Cyclobacteriaceae bacterium]